jgi:TolB protein
MMNRQKKKYIAVVLMVLFLGACNLNCTKKEHKSLDEGLFNQTKIAFVSERDGNREIYVMNADGSNQKRLTNHPAMDYDPYWTEDGKRIMFTTTRSGNSEVFIMNADGSDQKVLENPALYDRRHNLSHGGKKIAEGRGEIYVTDSDGSNKIRLTKILGDIYSPCWSPDGKHIAFVLGLVGRDGPYGNVESYLYVVNSDVIGSEKQLTDIDHIVCMTSTSRPSWSPDSRKIAFDSRRSTNNKYYAREDIYIINVDGDGLKRLTDDPAQDYAPCWSSFLSTE